MVIVKNSSEIAPTKEFGAKLSCYKRLHFPSF